MRTDLEMTEGVAGMWHYHLRKKGQLRALCGVPVMISFRPLDSWMVGFNPSHLPISYCESCDGLKDEENDGER